LRGSHVRRLVLIALFAAYPVVAALAQTASPYPALTIPLKIEQVPGKSVWYSTGNPGIPGKDNEGNTSNAGYVVTSEGVAVFDALGTPSLGWALLQDIRTHTDKKVRYVIASHYHADHIYGLQAFRDHTEAVIVAQERSGEYKDNEPSADEKANQRLDQRRAALFPWVNANTRVVPPDITFKERMTITLGETRADAALCRASALFQRHDDDGRAGRCVVRRRHRAERPDSIHEQRRRLDHAMAARAR
jgi:hypothetical protein